MKWTFQELNIIWNLWTFGMTKTDRRGWDMDEMNIYFGPLQFTFVSSARMEKIGKTE